MFSNLFCESNGIARIYGIHYTRQLQGAVKVFNKIVQNFLLRKRP